MNSCLDRRSIQLLSLDILCLVVLPNIIFGMFSFAFELNRPLLNADYLLVGLLYRLGMVWPGFLGLLVVYFSDALALVSQVFPVIRLSDAFYLLGFLEFAPTFYQVILIFGLLFFVFLLWVFLRASRPLDSPFLLIFNVFVFSLVFGFIFDEKANNKVWLINDWDVVDSQIIHNIDVRGRNFVRLFKKEAQLLEDSAHEAASSIWREPSLPLSKKIILIMNESWGVAPPAIQSELLYPLLSLDKVSVDFAMGKLDFNQSTVRAELKELCGLAVTSYNLSSIDEGFSECLPNLLKDMGYKTYAYHGASGLMYDRAFWYPRAGFEKTVFFESKSWRRRCYSFPGACDKEMLGVIRDDFGGSDRTFHYFLTLNSHALYDERDINEKWFECSSYGLTEQDAVCRNFLLQAQFFGNLAKFVSDEVFQDFDVLIVGDHEPPIPNQAHRKRFFEDGKVPWIRIKVSAEKELNYSKRIDVSPLSYMDVMD